MLEKTLINFGTYDVDNFGDLLFPFIVEYFLSKYYSKIIHVSPTGRAPVWIDAKQTCTVSRALENENIDGLVIGGGNLLSWNNASALNYIENDTLSRLIYPSFFYIPYILHSVYKIPFAYNHIGVARPIPENKKSIVKKTLDSASYVSCRDYASANYLIECGLQQTISVGLDCGFYIDKIFLKQDLIYYYHSVVESKYNIPKNKSRIVIHIKKRYMCDHLPVVFEFIKNLNRDNLHPILIPLGMCHGDDYLLKGFESLRGGVTIIDLPELLKDILSIIAASEYYIGSSLHGAIASVSYGNRIAIVADEAESGFAKFSGFLKQIGLPSALYSNWKSLYENFMVNGIYVCSAVSDKTRIEVDGANKIWEKMYKKLDGAKRISFNGFEHDEMVDEIRRLYGV